MKTRELSFEYIRGLTDGEGTFTFCTRPGPRGKKLRIPAFQLRMNIRDKDLVEGIRDFLKLKNKVYKYHYLGKDGAKRGPQVLLIVREIGSLKNIIVPLFYNRLAGYKAQQFNDWLDEIGIDPDVPESYKIINFLHKKGYFLKNPKYTD